MLLKILESGTMQIVFTMLFAYRTVNKYPNPLIFYRNTSFQQSDKQQIPTTQYQIASTNPILGLCTVYRS